MSVGSNLGERERTVLSVARLLETERIGHRIRSSSLYETRPVGVNAMDDFINAVIELQPLLYPEDLLKRLQDLEKRLGRRGGHNAPRRIDIDIVAFGRERVESERLTVPHPRYRERAFVLVPLREVAPGFRCPVTNVPVGELIDALPSGQQVAKVSSRRMSFARIGY